MLDRSLKRYRVILKRDAGTPLTQVDLPNGYFLVNYQTGDEVPWADNEASVFSYFNMGLSSSRI